MVFFPSKFPKGRVPDRVYFFNILNSLMEGYVKELIRYANEVRTSAEQRAQAQQTIEVNEEWWNKLKEIPFVSCKFNITSNFLQNAKEISSTCSRRAQNRYLRRGNDERLGSLGHLLSGKITCPSHRSNHRPTRVWLWSTWLRRRRRMTNFHRPRRVPSKNHVPQLLRHDGAQRQGPPTSTEIGACLILFSNIFRK